MISFKTRKSRQHTAEQSYVVCKVGVQCHLFQCESCIEFNFCIQILVVLNLIRFNFHYFQVISHK